ncbi:MAG: hypothetical protein ACFCUJ_08735 [Thiotrichales bacterium]
MNRNPNTARLSTGIERMTEVSVAAFGNALKSLNDFWLAGVAMNPMLPAFTAARPRSSCEIPSPCWLPRDLGEVHSVVCMGGVATLRVRVTNCQPRASQVTLEMAGNDLRLEIEPDRLELGPQERRWFTLKLFAPTAECAAGPIEAVVWVQGCNRYFLRWILEIRESAAASCREVEIDDCPDHVHHWYDHFYCVRPCFNQRQSNLAQRD